MASVSVQISGVAADVILAEAEVNRVRPQTIVKAIIETCTDDQGLLDQVLAGVDLEEIEGRVVGRRGVYIYKGKRYTCEKLAKHAGISPNTLNDRVKKQKWTVEQAVETRRYGRPKC